MFLSFFTLLKEEGIPVSLKGLLSLEKALSLGLISSLDEFYVVARGILIKSERQFDLYDQIFASFFKGQDLDLPESLSSEMADLLDEWLSKRSDVPGAAPNGNELTPAELEDYFAARLKDQKEQHNGGTRWIGTAGASPVGWGGDHQTGMRVMGTSTRLSALKVAGQRRYFDYREHRRLDPSQLGEALNRLRLLTPSGPLKNVDIDATITKTMKNGGEIEIVYSRELKDRLKIILLIDNGGASMDPHVGLIKTLFNHSQNQFKELKVCYFHNTVYEKVWFDPQRSQQPVTLEELAKEGSDTRLIIVGDASMSPYELLYPGGGVIWGKDRATTPGILGLKNLQTQFPHSVWLNPVEQRLWKYTRSIGYVEEVYPMFELSLSGLEKATAKLMEK